MTVRLNRMAILAPAVAALWLLPALSQRTQATDAAPEASAPAAVPPSADAAQEFLADKALLARLTQGNMRRFRFSDVAQTLPDVAFTDASGRPSRLSHWTADLLLLNVWASWCAPCREEIPALARLATRLDGLPIRVVTLSIDKSPTDAREFLVKAGAEDLPLLIDSDKSAIRQLQVEGAPTSLLIDRRGRELGRIAGAVNWDSDEALLLLKAAAMKTHEPATAPQR